MRRSSGSTRPCSKPPPTSAARRFAAFWQITFPLSLPGVIAGCFLVFIPVTGEFVIPDLLGGSDTLMIGKTLWSEFFTNRDWPLASAVAVILLLILVVPIVIFQNFETSGGRRRRDEAPTSWFNVTSVTLGLAFLYLPILLLVIYSFNASRLVTVWGGFSTKWYVELFHNQSLLDAAWVTLRVGLLSASVATVLGTLAAITLVRHGRFRGRTLFSGMIYAPLVMPDVITGLSLLLLFVAIDFARGFWTIVLAHITFSMCFVAVVVQSRLVTFDRSLEEAALDLGCPPLKTFLVVTLPLIAPGGDRRLDARLHPFARRPRHRQLHHRPRRHDAADEDLQPGAARGDAGDQCGEHHPDRVGRPRRDRRFAHHQAPRSGSGAGRTARRGGGVMRAPPTAVMRISA